MPAFSDDLPAALRLLRERAGQGAPPERDGWETGEAAPAAAELAGWLEALGYDFRDLQAALEEAHALAHGTSSEPAEPDPVEAFWVAGRQRLEADPQFREEVRALAKAAGLEEVGRRLDRLEGRLGK